MVGSKYRRLKKVENRKNLFGLMKKITERERRKTHLENHE